MVLRLESESDRPKLVIGGGANPPFADADESDRLKLVIGSACQSPCESTCQSESSSESSSESDRRVNPWRACVCARVCVCACVRVCVCACEGVCGQPASHFPDGMLSCRTTRHTPVVLSTVLDDDAWWEIGSEYRGQAFPGPADALREWRGMAGRER
jgi:hypothetical protein